MAIATLALPIVIAQLGSILQGWADTIMVGQYGTPELSASGFVNNVFNFIIYFLLGISYASTPVVGDYYSRGDYDNVLQARRSSILVSFLGSVFIVGLLLILYYNIERLGQPQELMPLIKPYFVVLLCSMPFLAVFNALKQCFDAVGDTKTPMWVMLGGNVLNVILNYLLIFGKFGCPELGLLGAGVATFTARVCMMLFLLFYRGRNSIIAKYRGDWSFRDAVRLTRIGMPISVQMCLEAASFNFCALFMGVDRCISTCCSSSDVYGRHIWFYDLLWYRCCGRYPNCSLSWSRKLERGEGYGSYRIVHVVRLGSDGYCAYMSAPYRDCLAYSQRGSEGHISVHCHASCLRVLSDGRLHAEHLCQLSACHRGCEVPYALCLHSLRRGIHSFGLSLCLRVGWRSCRRVVEFPVRTDYSWRALSCQIQQDRKQSIS